MTNVLCAYAVGALVFAIGLFTMLRHGDWQRARGLEKLVLFGPLFYAAPIAAFGTEHFTVVDTIASIVPAWIPWHRFWAYFVGACFIAAGLSIVSRIQARLAATLVGVTFFLFVVLMDAPAWARHTDNPFALALAMRELAFSGGALALAASLAAEARQRGARILAVIARAFVAIPILYFSLEQCLHPDHIPAIPLKPLTPAYIVGGPVWAYLAAAVYAIGGILLVAGWKTRAAATAVGVTVLVVELAVYVPIGVVQRASLQGVNFVFDTLMFCGAVLLLAGAMPRPGNGQGRVAG